MKKFLQTAFVAAMTFFAANSYGQLANGTILPAGINLTDLNGNTYDIDALLSGGKTIFIDVSATWCGPCWGFHQTHILDDLYLICHIRPTEELYKDFKKNRDRPKTQCVVKNRAEKVIYNIICHILK
jgi:thiol-disulfide isomerase/thioredoxin